MKRGFGSKLALTAAISLVASLQAACAQVAPPNGGASSVSGASGTSAANATQRTDAGTQQRFWYDGENRRELQVDPDWIVTRPPAQRKAPRRRPLSPRVSRWCFATKPVLRARSPVA